MLSYFSFVFSPRVKTIITVGAASLLVGVLASANWTPPPASPPACPSTNPACNPPIHTGNQAQNKEGALTLGAFGGPGGLLVLNGRVGIGTSAPTAKLEVAGNIKITGGSPGVGKVLTSDAVGLASWQTLTGGGGIGGSGTINQISKFTGATTIGDSAVTEVGGKVGIGTANPDSRFKLVDNTFWAKIGADVYQNAISGISIGGSNTYAVGITIENDLGPQTGILLDEKDSTHASLFRYDNNLNELGIISAGKVRINADGFSGPADVTIQDWYDNPSPSYSKRPGNVLLVPNAGKVGIGTANPDSRFKLVDNTNSALFWAKIGSDVYGNDPNNISGLSIGGSDPFAVGITIENDGGLYTGIALDDPDSSHASLFRYARVTDELGIISAGKVRINADGYTGSSSDVRIQDWSASPGRPGNVLLALNGGRVGIGRGVNNEETPDEKLHVRGNILASGSITPSDVRMKDDIKPLHGALSNLEKIRGVYFTWNKNSESYGHTKGSKDVGVIAQEVESVYPEMVTTYGTEGYKALDYGKLAAVLIEAVKELKAENEGLKARVKMLEDRIK